VVRPILTLLGIALFAACAHRGAIVIEHVNVVDVASGIIRPDQRVVIASRERRVIDGSGKFLIPALWDMHVHVASEAALAEFVRWGVTGVRDMGNELPDLLALRRRIESRELVGPRLIFGGPQLAGPPYPATASRRIVNDAAEAEAAVRELAAQGVDFIKVWEGVPRDAFFAIARAAREHRLPFAGHVPDSVSPAEASDAGQKSIEHMEFVPPRCLPIFEGRTAPADCDALLETTLQRLARNGTRLDPTVGSFRNFVGPERFPPLFAAFRRIAAPMIRRSGVRILAGTDVGSMNIVPGKSLHDELRLLVDAGWTPLEALRAATINATELLGLPPGDDAVLLDGNPLDDITNTARIAAVIRGGTFSRGGGVAK
jgi:imidazolonepropionase-like amidohydrolase